jgi:hypothetical protein
VPVRYAAAGHDLPDAVESVLVTPWTSGAERGDGGEDDVGLYLTQAVQVDR